MKAKSPRKATASKPSGIRARVIRIGNSRGIRLPKAFLKQINVGDEVILAASENSIIIEHNPRAGWDGASRKVVAEHGKELTEEDIEWRNAPMGPDVTESRS